MSFQERSRLHIKHKGSCYYCGRTTSLGIPDNGTRKSNKATIEHLWSRTRIRREQRKFNVPRDARSLVVLACHACNHEIAGTESRRSTSHAASSSTLFYRGTVHPAPIVKRGKYAREQEIEFEFEAVRRHWMSSVDRRTDWHDFHAVVPVVIRGLLATVFFREVGFGDEVIIGGKPKINRDGLNMRMYEVI